MNTECSETYEYDISIDDLDIKDKRSGHVYKNDLKYIEYNDININKVKNMPNYTFSTVAARIKECEEEKYEFLDLNHMDLTHIPNDVVNDNKLHKIKSLFMIDNNISVINMSIFNNLTVVDLSNNKLSSVPILPDTIEEITVKNNVLETVVLNSYSNLKRLDVSHNKLTTIDLHKTLDILICNNNNIKQIKSFPKLRKLSCKKNDIHTISGLPLIEIIECDNNKISTIINFPILRELYCNNNKITLITKLPKIEVVHCINNNISRFEYFSKLKELSCDYDSKLSLSTNYKVKDYYVYDIGAILFFE